MSAPYDQADEPGYDRNARLAMIALAFAYCVCVWAAIVGLAFGLYEQAAR